MLTAVLTLITLAFGFLFVSGPSFLLVIYSIYLLIKSRQSTMDVIQRIADSDATEIRDSARSAMSQLVVKDGQMTRSQYYTRLVETDPFDPSVPRYLTSTKGTVNSGRAHRLYPHFG